MSLVGMFAADELDSHAVQVGEAENRLSEALTRAFDGNT